MCCKPNFILRRICHYASLYPVRIILPEKAAVALSKPNQSPHDRTADSVIWKDLKTLKKSIGNLILSNDLSFLVLLDMTINYE